MTHEDLSQKYGTYGAIRRTELLGDDHAGIVTYDRPEEAARAFGKLFFFALSIVAAISKGRSTEATNATEYRGRKLVVELQ